MSSRSRNPLLDDPTVRAELLQAWQDSNPGVTGAETEQGGFILRDPAAGLRVARWPRGAQNSIMLPPHASCQAEGCEIVATFHTHPNTGAGFLQEPGETDRRAVRDDPDLKGSAFLGEFVISEDRIYLVSPQGGVDVVGHTRDILAVA